MQLTCLMTGGLLHNPVIADDGYTYEATLIQDWLKQYGTSPITKLPIRSCLRIDWHKQQQLTEFLEKNNLGTAEHFLQVIKIGDSRAINELAYLASYLAATDNLGNTALHWAAHQGLFEVVSELLTSEANLETKNYEGNTALHVAILANRLVVVKQLLPGMKDINCQNNEGDTPLHWAASTGNQEAVMVLLTANARLEALNYFQETPLHQAAFFGKLSTVRLLIKEGADCFAVNSENQTPEQVAIQQHYPQIVELIRHHSVNGQSKTLSFFSVFDKKLLQRIRSNDRALTQLNLTNHQIDAVSAKTLAEALQKNDNIIALDLWHNQLGDAGLENLAIAFKRDKCPLTTLYLGNNQLTDASIETLASAFNSNTSLTQLDLGNNHLTAFGAEKLTVILKNNSTLISLNLHNNHLGDNGAKKLARVLKNKPVFFTLYLGDNQVSAYGAKKIAAVIKMNRSFTELNLQHNHIGDDGVKWLAMALRQNHTFISLYLQDNQITDIGATELIKVFKNNVTLTTLYLQSNLISLANQQLLRNCLMRNQLLAEQLIAAVVQSNYQQIRELLHQGVSIHYPADHQDKNTALHLAVKQGNYSLVQWLINQGANSQLENSQGKTAWQVAQNTPLSVLIDEIKPQQVPSLKGFCLFKVKQIQINPELLPQEQQPSFAEQVASLPEELKSRLG